MNVDEQRLKTALLACTQHAGRLCEALHDLTAHMPVSVVGLAAASIQYVRTLDQFVYRFCKLQDTAGQQLFPALLRVLQEPVQEWSVRDRLNRLEQLRILPDVQAWDHIRAVRNRLTHEYPDAPERQAAILNLAWQTAPALIDTTAQVITCARKSLGA